tara:strand:+ start:48 stop:392 length:345 start_codon:yes stop_codon:yes gene_type:complete
MLTPQQDQFDNSSVDSLNNLPVDKNPPSHNEIHLMDTFFKPENKFTVNAIIQESKDSVIIAFLFVILSTSHMDSLIHKILPMTEKSNYIMLLLKGIIIGASFWLIKHFYLSKNS